MDLDERKNEPKSLAMIKMGLKRQYTLRAH